MRHSMLSRYYVQCDMDDGVDDWPDDRFWVELRGRLPDEVACRLVTGPSIEKSLTPLRCFLASALADAVQGRSTGGLEDYSDRALARVWKAVRFSWWLTMLMHHFPGSGEFDRRIQEAELDYLASSESAQRSFAENYTGLPL